MGNRAIVGVEAMSVKGTWTKAAIGTGLALLGCLWFGMQLLKDNGAYWDLSSESEYTLSVATQQLLNEIDEPLSIVVFEAQPSRSDASLRDRYMVDLMEQLKRSSAFVEWQLKNLDKERELAQRLGVTQYGAIGLTWKGVTLVIPERKMFLQQMGQAGIQFVGEDILQQALRTLVFPTVKVAYTLDGNGERSLYDGSSTGLSGFHALLENQGLQIKKLNLLIESAVPVDAALVFVLEPASMLSTGQQVLLLQYIQRGGRVWFASPHSHDAILTPIHIETLEGVVAESKTQAEHWDHPILSLARHEANLPLLSEDRAIVFGRTSAFSMSAVKQSGIRQTSFANLRSQAWLERTPTSATPDFDSGIDWRGTATLIAGVELASGSGLLQDAVVSTRVLVLGDIDWVSNGMFEAIPSNTLFAEVLLDWLMDTSDETTSSKYRTPTKVLITKPQLGALRILLLFPLPFLIALGGVMSWRRRR